MSKYGYLEVFMMVPFEITRVDCTSPFQFFQCAEDSEGSKTAEQEFMTNSHISCVT